LACELLGHWPVSPHGLNQVGHLLDRPIKRTAFDRHAVFSEQEDSALLADATPQQQPQRGGSRAGRRFDAERLGHPVEFSLDDVECLPAG
jgi:hypothetical protein